MTTTEQMDDKIIMLFKINENAYLSSSFGKFLNSYDPFPNSPKDISLFKNGEIADKVVIKKKDATKYYLVPYEEISNKYKIIEVKEEDMICVDIDTWNDTLQRQYDL
mgnify:CR=1 FL=1